MNGFERVLAGAAIGASFAMAAVPAQAALVQSTTPSVTTWLDTQLTGAALIYDANFYGTTEGRLVIVATGNTLAGPGVPAPAPGQSYLGATDQLRDEMLTLRINNTNGALVSGTVSVKPSNDGLANDSWQFVGTVTAFGFADNSGATTNTFDARFQVNSYNLSDVVQGLVGTPTSLHPNAPTICAVTDPFCGFGYLRFGTSGIAFTGGVGTGVNFGVDWVRGASVITGTTPNAQLGTFDDGIAAAAYVNNAVTTDIFMTVPVPGAFALFAAGLLGLGPLARRRQRRA